MTGRQAMKTNIERELNERAWSDDAFRKELLSDAKQAIEKLMGRPLPKETRVALLEDTAETLHFVLRRKPVPASGELTDEALGGVSGGYEMNKHLSSSHEL
jgi:hypothetical protein